MPLTEDEFVDEVQNSGVLVYLSATWLRELYQQVLATDLLKDVSTAEHPLIHLLSGKPLYFNLLSLFFYIFTILNRPGFVIKILIEYI